MIEICVLNVSLVINKENKLNTLDWETLEDCLRDYTMIQARYFENLRN